MEGWGTEGRGEWGEEGEGRLGITHDLTHTHCTHATHTQHGVHLPSRALLEKFKKHNSNYFSYCKKIEEYSTMVTLLYKYLNTEF